MKKIILAAAALVASVSAFAGTNNYLTNYPSSNVYLQLGGGLNIAADGLATSNTTTGNAAAIDFTVGKWVAPAVALELNGQFCFKSGNVLTPFFGLGFNVAYDLVAGIAGYKADRTVTVLPYLHAEYDFASNSRAGLGGGLKAPIRIIDRLYIVPEVRGVYYNDAAYTVGVQGNASLQALVGIQYQISKTHTFTSLDEAVQPYVLAVAEAEAAKAASQAKLEAAQARNAEAAKTNSALAAENEALKGELGNTSAVVNNILSTPACVFFEIGETRLSVKEAAHLDYIVKNVIAQGKELTFTVTGYTDKNTGSCARNRKLAKKRANYIKKMLVKRYGLTSDQFVVDYKPCTNVFTPIELNRAVIISAK